MLLNFHTNECLVYDLVLNLKVPPTDWIWLARKPSEDQEWQRLRIRSGRDSG